MHRHGPCQIFDADPSCIYSIYSVSYLEPEGAIGMRSEHQLSAILMYLSHFGKKIR
jgi:hypothetical protein